jgi:hypothetical protein
MPTEIKGVLALRKALRNFEPDLARETTKELAAFLKPVVRNARGFMPSDADVPSGWLYRPTAQGRWATRFYSQNAARRGIKYKTTPSRSNNRGFTALASILNTNIGGIIYEWAGRTAGVKGNFTPKLGGELKGAKRSMTGRAMYRAYSDDNGQAKAHVIKALEKAGRKFNERKVSV